MFVLITVHLYWLGFKMISFTLNVLFYIVIKLHNFIFTSVTSYIWIVFYVTPLNSVFLSIESFYLNVIENRRVDYMAGWLPPSRPRAEDPSSWRISTHLLFIHSVPLIPSSPVEFGKTTNATPYNNNILYRAKLVEKLFL